jgi:hypothetical protein
LLSTRQWLDTSIKDAPDSRPSTYGQTARLVILLA